MRWIFTEPTDTEEQAARTARIEKIDAWWRAFAGKAAELDAVFRGSERAHPRQT